MPVPPVHAPHAQHAGPGRVTDPYAMPADAAPAPGAYAPPYAPPYERAGTSTDDAYGPTRLGARPPRAGERATFVSCMDVPADVVDEAAVIVEDLWSVDLEAELWGTR